MESVRSFAPSWIKRFVWNSKHKQVQTNPSASPLVDFLAPRLDPNASVLDFGCAAGNLLAALRRQGWKGNYTGVDISPKAIAVAKQMNDPRAQWFVSPMETFVIPGNFDVICFVESLYYIRLECVERVLRQARGRAKSIYVRIWDVNKHAAFVQHLGACENPRADLFVLKGSQAA